VWRGREVAGAGGMGSGCTLKKKSSGGTTACKKPKGSIVSVQTPVHEKKRNNEKSQGGEYTSKGPPEKRHKGAENWNPCREEEGGKEGEPSLEPRPKNQCARGMKVRGERA